MGWRGTGREDPHGKHAVGKGTEVREGLQLTWDSGVSLAATPVSPVWHPPRASPDTWRAGKERGPG